MMALIALLLMGDGFIAQRDDPEDEAAFALLRRLGGSRDPDDGTPGRQAGRPAGMRRDLERETGAGR